ncbi:aminopeptidase N [uncultured Microbulbifer sp.]|mgnify:CR=1 FL=1|uniref:aminopeptidase N n=1 Tax=uncultured Microbulbifer sp. TaxID=348147 RepID=UPI0025D55E8A|nr:aminopeptidase N [uncultured Microbulbifer sp.]
MPQTPLHKTFTRTLLATVVGGLLATGAVAAQDKGATDGIVARAATSSLTAEYAALRRQQIADVDYRVAVTLDNQSESFDGEVVATTRIARDLQQPLTIDFAGGKVKAVSVDGSAVPFEYNDHFISIAPQHLGKGEHRIAIEYSHPYSSDGSGLHRFKDPEDGSVYLYTHFEPYKANRFFPHFDQPDLKARYTVEVTAPADWQVVTAAREDKVDTLKNGFKVWHFPQTKKFSSYIFPLHAGPFVVWENDADGIPLRLFARKTLAEHVKPEDWFKFTRESFAFYQKYFDIPYAFGKYDQLIVPDFTIGAMENVGAVTFNENYVARGDKTQAQRQRLANVIAHEMAHMWFGDLVTMKWWNGLWLKESFATYMASLALAENSEFGDVWQNFYLGTKQWAYGSDQLPTTHPIEVLVPNTDEAFSNFDGITYGKGGSVLKQLPFYLGTDAFREGVSDYLKSYSYGNAELQDFMGSLGKAADKNLADWTQKWLYQAGLNTISASFECSNDRISELTIQQAAPVQYPQLREQRVQLGIYQMQGDSMARVAKVPVTYSGASTEVKNAEGMPCPQILNLNDEDWGYVKTRLDDASVAQAKQHINQIDSAFTRLMLWQSLFDAVTDAQMPLSDWIDFALQNAGEEQDINVIRLISSRLQAANAYLHRIELPAAEREKLQGDIEAFVWQQLNRAPAGSDTQKTWFGTFAEVAHSEAALQHAQQMLAGELTIEGLELDQDRRWPLIILLNRHLFGNYEKLVADQLKADNSARAQNAAISARAIRPTGKAKREWLHNILNKRDEYKLSQIRAAASHMFPADQLALYRQFSDKLFAAVPAVSATADTLYNKAYAMLFPVVCSKAEIDQYSRALEKNSDLMPALGRVLKDRKQQSTWCSEMSARQNSN